MGISPGQLVWTQVAAVAVLLGALNGTVALAAAVAGAIVLLGLTWPRMCGRWAFEWLATAVRYGARRHVATLDTPTALLDFVSPGCRMEACSGSGRGTGPGPQGAAPHRPGVAVPSPVGRPDAGDPAAMIVDGLGLTAVLELADPTNLLVEDQPPLPAVTSLLPPPEVEHPPVRIQVLLAGAPAPAQRSGRGTPATSYRQLTDGRLLAYGRALLAVRVLRADGWAEDDLRRALSGLVRKLPRRLGGMPVRPLGDAAAARAIAEFAHDDGATGAREGWASLRMGGLVQATYRLDRWPGPGNEASGRLISRILSLPAAATTVALTAGPHPRVTAIHVRVAAHDTAGLAVAGNALRRLMSAEQAHARRLDGEHLDGLAATLPFGGGRDPGAPGCLIGRALPATAAADLDLPGGTAGLMLGRNRRGQPVVARVFRPEPTRILLVGGVRCAELVVLRAMALGGRVVVQTSRPRIWEPFVRGAAAPGESIVFVPPGRAVEIPAGSPLRPLFVVVDVGPGGGGPGGGGNPGGGGGGGNPGGGSGGGDNPGGGGVPGGEPAQESGPLGGGPRGSGWQATLVVRDEFGPADMDAASRADLLLLQPLRAEEANLIGTALGLGDTASWLTRIRPDMVGLVSRRVVRWAALAQTATEHQLIGAASRA